SFRPRGARARSGAERAREAGEGGEVQRLGACGRGDAGPDERRLGVEAETGREGEECVPEHLPALPESGAYDLAEEYRVAHVGPRPRTPAKVDHGRVDLGARHEALARDAERYADL